MTLLTHLRAWLWRRLEHIYGTLLDDYAIRRFEQRLDDYNARVAALEARVFTKSQGRT